MNESRAESLLAILYSGTVFLSIVSVTCLVIAWQHWVWTLDVCLNIDCGCILYGTSTSSTFMGGDVKLCHFGVYGLVPAIVIGLCLAGYHGYRYCVNRNLDEPTNYNGNRHSFNGRVVVIGPKRRAPCKQWMPAVFCAALIACLSLVHAVVTTDGYYKTCEQYRRNLINRLDSTELESKVIHNRLACTAILDYMDYLHPDANNWRRSSEINTGFTLQLAITCTWLNFFAWTVICFINFLMARKRLKNIGERFFCCSCC